VSFFNELKRRNVFRVGIAYVVIAWLLAQVADLAFEGFGTPDWAIKTLLFLLAVGFPVAIFFAWAFELTPEGIKKEKDVDRSWPVTRKTRKLDYVIIALIAIAFGYFIGESRVEEDSAGESTLVQQPTATVEAATEVISIAVLPFVNMSPDADNEYFSDGVAEEILNVLARIPTLKVAARTSAFQYKGENRNIAEIARALHVNNVLEGSVRKSGNQVRVTAQLIKAEDGFHLWSETFDRELTNIFEIQDEIAESIAAALKVKLSLGTTQENHTGTTSTKAYDFYLRGINQWHQRTLDALQNAIELFEQAILIDPEFARAHAGLALTWAVLPDYSDIPYFETAAKTKIAADAALALDPNSAEAVAALIYSTDDVNLQLQYGKKAITLNPSFATAHQWYASTLEVAGDQDAAVAEMERAYELDPRAMVIGINMAWMYYSRGKIQESERVYQQVLSQSPNSPPLLEYQFGFKLLTADRETAEQAGIQLVQAVNRTSNNVRIYLDLIFDPVRSEAAAEEIFNYPTGNWWNPDNLRLVQKHNMVQAYVKSGQYEKALEVMRYVIANRPIYNYAYFRVDRNMRDFICQAEVQQVLAATKLPPMLKPYSCEESLQ